MTEATATKRPARRTDPSTAVIGEVKAARKQVGDRRMPVAGGRHPVKGRAHHVREAARWRSVEQGRELAGSPGWDSTLLTAVFTALADQDPQRTRSGLVHLAALAVAAVEAIDREATT
ncbi:hypothetical protein [Streptomyces catenulae]|uniref:Uncharacterized protein n=1 Tax=Streptomyces catenulae TaxID=66875 RepID=A0ABV2YTG9_9ACTN|nr:hypothetical protein [Streptomyces catenulae]